MVSKMKEPIYSTTSAQLVQALLLLVVISKGGEAVPIKVPDLSKCELASDSSVFGPPVTLHFNCCLTAVSTHKIVDFSFKAYKPTRKHIRRPAHTASEDYITKYNKAYELMRALPDDDPRSFLRQANIHCAFCNGAYMQAGAKGVVLQVHFSWLFFPWHRWYLYFHERILASLVGDPSFSLMYWNWDDQVNGGNVMPEPFVRNGTAIYDSKRNPAHLPPFLVRLSPANNSTNNSVIVNQNLNELYQSIVTASTAELFMGGAYRVGTDLASSTVINAPLGGSVEDGAHNAVHFWTGDARQQLLQDMGTFTTAARDPIFFAHHSNVDRLWEIWRFKLPGGERQVHTDPDFLDAEFVFYDENANLVKVKVRDALDNKKLGIYYKSVHKSDKLWMNYRPLPATNGSAVRAAASSSVTVIQPAPMNRTIDLGSGLAAIVDRPAGNKPKHKEEVLIIQGLEVVRESFVSLVVFLNMPNAGPSTPTSSAEYVGTFNIVPSASKHRRLMTNVKFEIGDNLKRIGIQDEEHVVITIVVDGTQKVTIKGLQIKYE